jgi:hypothetical protein
MDIYMIPEEHKERFAYHFTAIQNLDDIFKHGLLSTNLKDQMGLQHSNIANADIQNRRSEMPVTCGPKGFVHDYVPFYFTKRSPMLKAVVYSKNIDQYEIVYFAIPISQLLQANTVFTDTAANRNSHPEFYSNPKGKLKSAKMAEMLVHQSVPLTSISHMVVWDEHAKARVGKILKNNNVRGMRVECAFVEYFKPHYFNYPYNNRISRVTGPKSLKAKVERNVEAVIALGCDEPIFDNLDDVISKIEEDFCCIRELAGIEGLETDNEMHYEDVGRHTRRVVKYVRKRLEKYNLSVHEENLVIFSAYLHDIGKGPKSRWPDGIQKVDIEHPVRSLPMLKRILTEDVGGLTHDDIRRIHMLVVYDDLVGEIVAKGRNKQQLFDIVKNKDDVRMLLIIGMSDMKAIDPKWVSENVQNIRDLRQQAFEYLENEL